MDASRSETWFLVALLAVAVFGAWLILSPYLGVLVLAGTLAFVFRPLYERFLKFFHYEFIAALAIVIIVTLIVFIPLGLFGVQIFVEATGLYATLASHGGFDFGVVVNHFMQVHFPNVPTPDLAANFNTYAQQGLTWLIQHLGSLFSSVAQIFFTAFLSLFGLFYCLKDGDRLKKWTLEIVPLSPKYTEGIVREMEAVGKSVIEGTLVVAILQGIVMGFGFFLFHIPDTTFWGALVVLASVIPIVGAWLVVVPAIGYLFFIGQTGLAIGLAIWGLVFVNIIYNVLSPQLMHRGVNMHPYLILLSVFGGIGFFGPIGFLIGPLVMALLFSLLKIYAKMDLGRHDN